MENSKELYERCYDILVEHAGASNNVRDKQYFVWLATNHEKFHQLTEYRFCGSLGFGGKFWRNAGKLYISCYPEDENPKRLAIIEKVNKMIAKIMPLGGVWDPP
jgi:hypothetical protein